MVSIGPIIALVSVLIPLTLMLMNSRRMSIRRRWRPKRCPELNGANSPMSIRDASAAIEQLLRMHWRSDPKELHRLDRLLVIFEPDCDYTAWDKALSDVQTWPDTLDQPTELSDRVFWDFQAFVDSNHCTAFSATRTKTYFMCLVATLSELGINLPDADEVTFSRI